MALKVRTGGSATTGQAAPPPRNIQFLLVRHLVSEAFYKNAKLTRSVIQRVWEFPTCKRLDENSVPDPACQVVKRVKIVIKHGQILHSWEQRKVGEVSKRVIVGLATSVTPYYREEGVPILRNLNIKENYLDDTDILFLDRPYAESQVSKQIHAGDVLTVHTGYIGISCVVPEKYDNCLTFTTLITTTDDAVLEGAFLAQYLNSEIGMSAVQAVTTRGGRQNLNTNDFVKVEIRYSVYWN